MGYTALIFEDDMVVSRSLLINVDWGRFDFSDQLTATNVPDGQLLFEMQKIDLVLCDIEVIGGTGLDLLKWARENGYETEFIFLTNYAEFSYAQEAIKYGANDYILKTEPMEIIERAVERSAARIKHKRNVSADNQITRLAQGVYGNVSPKDSPFIGMIADYDLEEWERCLLDAEKIKLLDNIKNYFDNAQIVKTRYSADTSFLISFRHDFVRMAKEALSDLGIQPDAVFAGELTTELYEKSVKSTFDMIKWLSHFIDAIIICLDKNSGGITLIKKVKSYIRENYSNDINRQNIASVVSVNSDYLSRLFNKQVGVSIPEYIAGVRIEHAKRLMLSDLPVSNIALEVGIENFSYFSKLFKKYTGMTPTEYKKSLSSSAESCE